MQKSNPYTCLISMKLTGFTPEHPTLSAENLIEIGVVVSEIWPGKLKSGRIYLGGRVYLAKYSIEMAVLFGGQD